MSTPTRPLSKRDFKSLSDFRYRLRHFLRASENLVHAKGITSLQYQLLLHVKGYTGREWVTVDELAERLQTTSHDTATLITCYEGAGLVEKHQSNTDARQVRVHLSKKSDSLVTLLTGLHQSELSAFRHALKFPHLNQLAEPASER